MKYENFLDAKRHLSGDAGFEPVFLPDRLFPFQRALVEWAVRKGRAALFEDCGLGKTFQQLVWGQNVVMKVNRPVLFLTPLSVGFQTVEEARKFGLSAVMSRDGRVKGDLVVTNYQQLHKFDWQDFGGVVCDESSILKSFDGQIKAQVTLFMRKIPFRLLCTATAAPNDFIEIGTSSEALGELGFMDVVNRFFKQDNGVKFAATDRRRSDGRADVGCFGKYRFRGHAEPMFWRWVCSWARAVRKPSDMGFSDDGYDLPNLILREHVVSAMMKRDDFLFEMPAHGLQEQREERRRTIRERCETAAALHVAHPGAGVAWCHLNDEGKMLAEMIPGAVEVCGDDSDEAKEEKFAAFATGEFKKLVTKPVIAGFGLNWQHCAHQTTFPSHSYEQFYQSVRRSYRFGQKSDVVVDVVASEGEAGVLANLNRKAEQSQRMFQRLVELMNDELKIRRVERHNQRTELPTWLS
jgi:hypothetical protein